MKKIVIFCSFLFSIFLSAQNSINAEGNVAIDSYDVVSYFLGSPKQGLKNLSTSYQGVTYHFSAKENLIKFKKNPEKYLPQYGGWC